jgi:ubiquitin-like modifier-activating enzyme ATG7
MAAKAEVPPRPLKVDAIKISLEIGFWDALRGLKLDVIGTDDSPIPITGRILFPIPSLPILAI